MQGNKGFNMEKQNHAPRKQHQHPQHPPPAVPANGQQANSQSESRARLGGQRVPAAPGAHRRDGAGRERAETVEVPVGQQPAAGLQPSGSPVDGVGGLGWVAAGLLFGFFARSPEARAALTGLPRIFVQVSGVPEAGR